MNTPSPTVRQAFDSFLDAQTIRKLSENTMIGYRQDFAAITERFAVKPEKMQVCELDRSVLKAAFVDYAGPRSKSTVLRAHATWTKFYAYLVAEGFAEGSPMPGIEKPGREHRFSRTPDGWETDFQPGILKAMKHGKRGGHGNDKGQALYRAWPERDFAILVLLLSAGVRASELCALNISSFEGKPPNFVLNVVGKGGKPRSIPIEPAVDAAAAQYLETRKERFPDWKQTGASPLFLGARNEGGTKRITRRQLSWIIETAFRSAGMESRRAKGAMTHSFRHVYGSDLASKGVPVSVIKELMGHESINTTQGYMDSVAVHKREGAQRSSVYEFLAEIDESET